MNTIQEKLSTIKEKEKVKFPFEGKEFIISKKKHKLNIETPLNFLLELLIKIFGFFIVFFGFIILVTLIATIVDGLHLFDYEENGESHLFSARGFVNYYIEKLAIPLLIIFYFISRKLNSLIFKIILKKYYGAPYKALLNIITEMNKGK